MNFHFVDRITACEPGSYARGIKNATRNEGFYYWSPDGTRALSPAVVTEALAQLGSWLKMATCDFTKRPVLLADEHTSYHGWVEAGDQIELFVKILDFDDVVVTTSYAAVRGEKVLVTRCCRGYMLPIEEFDDRDTVIRQFNNLNRPDLKDTPAIVSEDMVKLHPPAGRSTWENLQFVDGLIEHVPHKRVSGYKNFSSCEPYFATHFPYKPVAPGVLLMTFMGEVCQYLLKESVDTPLRGRALIPLFTRNARFRKFVEPGDQCVMHAEIISGDPTKDFSEIVVQAKVMANGKRVLQGEMGFRTMFGADSRPLRDYFDRFQEDLWDGM